MALKVGCDPEFFLFDTVKKMFVSAHDLVPGSKSNPYPLEKGAVQVDGTAVEFNIEPAETGKQFHDNIIMVLSQIREMIPRRYNFDFTPAIHYAKSYWDTIPDKCKELGCDPDYNYNGTMQQPPKPQGTLRTAGGHIHAGWTWVDNPLSKSHMMDCQVFNQNTNFTNQRYWDSDNLRKTMYGNNKPYRPKKYGIELRSLSSAWVKYPALYEYLFDVVKSTYNNLIDPLELKKYVDFPLNIKEIVL